LNRDVSCSDVHGSLTSGTEGVAGRGIGVLTAGVEVAAVIKEGGEEADGVNRGFFLGGIAMNE